MHSPLKTQDFKNIIEEIIKEVLRRLSLTKVIIIGEKINIKCNDYFIYNYIDNKSIDNYDIILLSSLSISSLSSLALLNPKNDTEDLIIKNMIIGKKIYILEKNLEHKKYVNICNQNIYKQCISYENILKTYGIKFIKNIDNLFYKKHSKNLISINNIKNMVKDNKILLDKNTILTPLAKEYIFENNIILERV